MLKRSDIPNALCVLRILLVVPIILTLARGHYAAALLLVFVAGFSDLLDGYLAKRFDWRSRLGGMLDPIADKLLLVSLFVALASLGLIPAWLAAVVIGRDLIILTGALSYSLLIGPLQPEPSPMSKVNTLVQLVCIVVVLLEQALAWPLRLLVVATGAGVLVTTVVSGLDYVIRWSAKAMTARG